MAFLLLTANKQLLNSKSTHLEKKVLKVSWMYKNKEVYHIYTSFYQKRFWENIFGLLLLEQYN